MSEPAIGARVAFGGHDGWFVADIFRVGGANVVRASGKIEASKLNRPATGATHHVSDFPLAGFWRPDLGVLVVPENQVRQLSEGGEP